MYNVYDDAVLVKKREFEHFFPAFLAPAAAKLGSLAFKTVKNAFNAPTAQAEAASEEEEDPTIEESEVEDDFAEDAQLDDLLGPVVTSRPTLGEERPFQISYEGDAISTMSDDEKHAFADTVDRLFDQLIEEAIDDRCGTRNDAVFDAAFAHWGGFKKLRKRFKKFHKKFGPGALLKRVAGLAGKVTGALGKLGPLGSLVNLVPGVGAVTGAANMLSGLAGGGGEAQDSREEEYVNKAMLPVATGLDNLAQRAFRDAR